MNVMDSVRVASCSKCVIKTASCLLNDVKVLKLATACRSLDYDLLLPWEWFACLRD